LVVFGSFVLHRADYVGQEATLGACRMDDMRFADIMQRERERLDREREEIVDQQKDLENKLTEVDRELAAIDAYEAAKTGKAATPRRQQPASRKSEATIKQLSVDTGARAKPGTRRETILNVIGENPSGLSRGEILERIGLKGNKSAQKSVSNALTALIMSNRVARRDGKYVIGG
jgi:hypothetical protein